MILFRHGGAAALPLYRGLREMAEEAEPNFLGEGGINGNIMSGRVRYREEVRKYSLLYII